MVQCDAALNRRFIASFFMQWKPGQRKDVGAAAGICDRNKPCIPEGWVRHWGYAGALPITRNSQMTGPSGGFGWHIDFDAGAPKTLQFTEIQTFVQGVAAADLHRLPKRRGLHNHGPWPAMVPTQAVEIV
jgi:hypothetical protein